MQVCTSPFLQSVWINDFFAINFINSSEQANLADTDFRKYGTLIFQEIVVLCSWVQYSVANAANVFNLDESITSQALSRMYKTWFLSIFCADGL
jgi:hypothetical protein